MNTSQYLYFAKEMSCLGDLTPCRVGRDPETPICKKQRLSSGVKAGDNNNQRTLEVGFVVLKRNVPVRMPHPVSKRLW